MKIHLYILRQLAVAFLFAVGALLFIALPGIAVNTVHKLPNVDLAILAQFLPLVLQSLAPYVLPLCFMLSVVAVFGRLAADKEWIAIHMAGIHPLKTLFTPFLMATALGLLTFWMVSTELPNLKQRQKRFLLDATASVIENVQDSKTRIQQGDFLLMSLKRDEGGDFIGVYVRRPKDDDNEQPSEDIFASRVSLRVVDDMLIVRARDLQIFDPVTGAMLQQSQTEFSVNLLERIGAKPYKYDRAKYLVSGELRSRMAAGTDGLREIPPEIEGEAPTYEPKPLTESRRREFRFMLHYRASMFAIFYLFLGLGSATGLLMRRGTQLGALAVAAGYGILYYVLSMRIGKELGKAESVPPWVGAWLTTIVGGVFAVFMLRRAMRR